MAVKNLEDLFIHELQDVYDAEKRILRALPKMARAASSDSLRSAFEQHRTTTEKQVQRLEQVFKQLDKKVRGRRCPAMEGLIEEGTMLIEEEAEPAVLDAGLIGSAQKIEHYEIAAYGTLATFAKQLGQEKAVQLLEQTLAEEKETDHKLTELAMEINAEAEHEGNGMEREERSAPRRRTTTRGRGKKAPARSRR